MNESFEKKDGPHRKIEIGDITNPEANQAGEYVMHRNTAVDILNFAIEQGVLTPEQSNLIIYDLSEAKNAFEMLKAQRPITRILYQHAVDYSDILLGHGAIDRANYLELKSNLSRGSEFTTRDLANADHLDTVGARATAGMEDPATASEEILRGHHNMQLSKKLYPEKSGKEEDDTGIL